MKLGVYPEGRTYNFCELNVVYMWNHVAGT